MRLRLGGRPTFWIALVIGWAVIGFGLAGALDDDVFTHPASLARWLAAGLVLHDGLWVPVSLAGAVIVGRVARGPGRGPLLWAIATGAVLDRNRVAIRARLRPPARASLPASAQLRGRSRRLPRNSRGHRGGMVARRSCRVQAKGR